MIYYDTEKCRKKKIWEVEYQKFCFECIKFETKNKYPAGNVDQKPGYLPLDFREAVQTRDRYPSAVSVSKKSPRDKELEKGRCVKAEPWTLHHLLCL